MDLRLLCQQVRGKKSNEVIGLPVARAIVALGIGVFLCSQYGREHSIEITNFFAQSIIELE